MFRIQKYERKYCNNVTDCEKVISHGTNSSRMVLRVTFWCYDDPHMLHNTQNSNHPAALSDISSVTRGEKVFTLTFGCLSNYYIFQYDGEKTGLLIQQAAAFEWNEWFFQAAHLRKTDDDAVGVIYCDFTVMNMRSTFSSCKCGCAKTLALLQRELFLQHYKERFPIPDWSPYWWM